ncbi:ABC transporter permease, partial [Micromonospora sp. NPDC052213]
MIRLTLRQLRAEALRLLLSSLAIVLGVAFIAGTLIFVDGMRAGAYERAGTFDRHTDLAVYSATKDPLPTALVDRVRALDGVAAAEGELLGSGGGGGGGHGPGRGDAGLPGGPVDPAPRARPA